MTQTTLPQAFSNQPRFWRTFRYVYPAISRRSRGLSIGINLSPGKACNFNCAYCSVDRCAPTERESTNLVHLRIELDRMLSLVSSGEVWRSPEFADIPDEFRELRDITFSGDGEPTLNPRLVEACQLVARAKRIHRFFRARMVLLTNGSQLRRSEVQSALTILDANQGDLWVKLDAGTAGYFKRINQCNVLFENIVQNIMEAGKERPIVLQSMFAKPDGRPMPAGEFAAYCDLIAWFVANGARIKQVQIYTITRKPAHGGIEPMDAESLKEMARTLRCVVPGVRVDEFQGQ